MLFIVGGLIVLQKAMSVRAERPDFDPIFANASEADKWRRRGFHPDIMEAIRVMNRAAIETHGKPIRVSNILGHRSLTEKPQVDFSRLSPAGRLIAKQTERIVDEIGRRARPNLPPTMPLFVVSEGTDNDHWHAGPWREKATGKFHYTYPPEV